MKIFLLWLLVLNFAVLATETSRSLREKLPRVKPIESLKPRAADFPVEIKFDFLAGWALNHDAHNWLAVFEITPTSTHLLKELNNRELRVAPYSIGRLALGHQYRLQGSAYFCEKTRASLCAIQSFDENIEVSENGSKEPIVVNLRP